MTLPFPRLIMSIMQHKRVQFPHGLPLMKREDHISAQTMTRSKAHLHASDEERVEGEDTTPEGGNNNEDIDNFTLDPEDMEASPT